MTPADLPDAAADGAAADAFRHAVAAFARALSLSCQVVRHPREAALANEAVAAHRRARAWAEEAVRRAGGS